MIILLVEKRPVEERIVESIDYIELHVQEFDCIECHLVCFHKYSYDNQFEIERHDRNHRRILIDNFFDQFHFSIVTKMKI